MKTITGFFSKAIFPTLILCCFCIALPPAFKSLSLGVLALVLLFSGELLRFKYKAREVLNVKNPVLWIVGLYVLYCLGMLWSSNMEYGLDDLKVKLPLLVVPLLMGFVPRENFTKKKLWYYALSFSAGLVVVLVYCLVRAILNAIQPDGFHSEELFYGHLTASFHATYLTLFCCTSLIIVYLCPLARLFRLKDRTATIIKAAAILFFNVLIILITTRIAFIAMMLIYAVILVDLFRLKSNIVKKAAVLLLFCANIFTVFNLDRVKQRHIYTLTETGIEKPSEQTPKGSYTSLRMFILTQVPELVLRQPFFGYGTGDCKDALEAFYKEKETGFTYYYNAHNQFFQTAISLGIVGLGVLGMIFLCLVLRLWRKDRAVLLVGIVAMAMFFFTESILERQAGVHFCAFAFLWFNCFAKHKKIKD